MFPHLKNFNLKQWIEENRGAWGQRRVILEDSDFIVFVTRGPNSLELLIEQDYLWNSNSFSYDLPFVWSDGERELVELPRQPFGDGRIYGHRDSGNPNDALVVWKSFFDDLYEESSIAPGFSTFQFHPYISSRFGRAGALKQLIEHMKTREGVWFATGSEVAEWWQKQGFSTQAQVRAAAGV